MCQALAAVVININTADINHFSRQNIRPAGHFVATLPHAQLCQEVGLGWAHGFALLLTLGHFRMANASNPNKKTEDAPIIKLLRKEISCGLSREYSDKIKTFALQ